MKKNRIIVIGGGYAGLRAIEKLAKNPHNEIMLFDKESYHFMQTNVYDLIANEHDFAQVSVDLFTFCLGFDENVSFVKEEVTQVNFEQKKITTQTQRYGYDYLIIAVGARTKFVESVEGLRTHAHGIKVLHRAMYFKQKFEMALYKKVQQSGITCHPMNIVVAGGGLSGVEIAAQMASFAEVFYKKNNFMCRRLNIVLINAAEEILSGLDPWLVKKSAKRLEKLGVKTYHKTKVSAITQESVTLSSGERLPIDFMVFAGGIEPNALVHALDVAKNEKGYIVTNEYLQLPQYKEVFAIGDCTTIYENQTPIAPTADVAEQMAEHCALNIENHLKNRALKPYSIKPRGVLIALGRRYGAIKIFGFHCSGYLAFIIKKTVEKHYFKNLDIRSHRGCKKIFS